MPLARFTSWKFGQREKLQRHRNIAGSAFEKLKKLYFGIFQSRVRHIVDQSYPNVG
jgi:hypothetical protein